MKVWKFLWFHFWSIYFIFSQKIVRKRSTFRKTRRQSCITLQRTTTDAAIGEGTESSNIDPNAKLRRGNTFSRKKEKENQLKLTRTLLTLGLFHFLTTIMETIAFFIFTVYRSAWMNFKGRCDLKNINILYKARSTLVPV